MAKQTVDLNTRFENFLTVTLWIWLPFFILFPLLRMTRDRIRKSLDRG